MKESMKKVEVKEESSSEDESVEVKKRNGDTDSKNFAFMKLLH
jgi:hypothetical protein